MAKKKDSTLKLPDDFLGTVQAFLQTPPPVKKKRATKKRKARQKATKQGHR